MSADNLEFQEALATENDEKVEDSLGENEALPFVPYSMTSYGAEYTVELLINRLRKNLIYIPDFQRDYVWKPNQASHFIETLLLGLPVPAIFLSKDAEEKMLVIDGRQRLTTLLAFYDGKFPDGRPFLLTDVQPELENKSCENLEDEHRRRLDDAIIRATILQQNAPKEDFQSSIYFVFRRLNSDATPLTPQEIRSAILNGPLNDLLKRLDEDELWQFFVNPSQRKRKRGQELLLRFFAFYGYSHEYAQYRSMDDFLTRYMQKFAQADAGKIEALETLALKTLGFIREKLGKVAFRRAANQRNPFNAAVFDSVMVGVAKRLQQGPITDLEAFKSAHANLLVQEDFENAVRGSTGQAVSVQTRISLALKAFGEIR